MLSISDEEKQFSWMAKAFPFLETIFGNNGCKVEASIQMEIHFIPTKDVDLYANVKHDYESTLRAIENNSIYITTTQFCFLERTSSLIENGYKVYVHSDGNIFEVA